MLDKVLILSASAGAGHVRAAQAIERATVAARTAREVRHIDVLEYTNKVFRNLYSKAYIDMVNKAPELLGWLYDYLDKPWENERGRLAFNKLNTRPLVKLLARERPDVIVCTHFLPAEIISWLTSENRLNSPQAIVVTDFDVHAMWLCRHYQHYFVALDETRAHLEKLGIDGKKITVSGIPIDPVFAQPKDKQAMRDRHGLAPDRITILLSAGGYGVGPIDRIIQSLLEVRRPIQIIAICGRSEEMKQNLDALAATLEARGRDASLPLLKVVGFTTAMDEYMSAADILLGKPGGLTSSEALAKGLAFVIINPIPGQEERNSDHLLEEGVAIRCNNLPTLAYKIERLLDDPKRLAAMRENALRLAHPLAAQTIVDKLLRLNTR